MSSNPYRGWWQAAGELIYVSRDGVTSRSKARACCARTQTALYFTANFIDTDQWECVNKQQAQWARRLASCSRPTEELCASGKAKCSVFKFQAKHSDNTACGPRAIRIPTREGTFAGRSCLARVASVHQPHAQHKCTTRQTPHAR